MSEKPIIVTKLLILGAGPAGCTAAIYAARANLNPILLTGMEPGGQLTTTHEVSNWPGETSISGLQLTDNMLKHAEAMGTQVHYDTVYHADFSKRPFTLTADQHVYQPDAVIIATGAKAKYLGLASEKQFMGKGVSACAVCDGPFYKGKEVVVVGGGNTALTEAIFLSNLASKVTLVHRKGGFRAEHAVQTALHEQVADGKIHLHLDSVIDEVLGDDQGVTGVRLNNIETNEKQIIHTQALFVAIGHHPATEIFKDQLKIKNGYIVTQKTGHILSTQTSVPGVFAAGDVQDATYRQAITSAASGCMAALDAEVFLNEFHLAR